jgi:hypothetical protein
MAMAYRCVFRNHVKVSTKVAPALSSSSVSISSPAGARSHRNHQHCSSVRSNNVSSQRRPLLSTSRSTFPVECGNELCSNFTFRRFYGSKFEPEYLDVSGNNY